MNGRIENLSYKNNLGDSVELQTAAFDDTITPPVKSAAGD